MYPQGALLNHSCSPNCILTYEGTVQVIRCIRSVSKGQELTHSYVDLCWPTSARQAHLSATYGFKCACTRCVDGLFFEGVDVDAALTAIAPLEPKLSDPPPPPPHRAVAAAAASASELSASVSAPTTDAVAALTEAQRCEDEARECSARDDLGGERAALTRALALRRSALHPLHTALYATRGLALSAALVAGDATEARAHCAELVRFLEATLAHVPNHPLLALQLFTLGDLEAACGRENEARNALKRAETMLVVSTGADSELCTAARTRLASLGTNSNSN